MSRQVPVTLPEGYVEFYKNLETWQNQEQFKLQKLINPEKLNILQLLSNNNKPLIKLINVNIDPEQFKTLYKQLLDFIKVNRTESTEIIDKLYKAAIDLDFNLLIRKILEDDYKYLAETATNINVPPEMFIFTLDHTLRPFLRVYASPLADAISEETFQYWNFPNICPFCGAKSRLGRLRAGDGRRFMFCDRCFTEWETRALFCVHCGNDEVGTIRYLSIENDPAYQIYVCDKCKGYLKTYDERKKDGKVDLFITNVETVYLDMLAQENGYQNHDDD
ncbi:MAG: formate dehydrogenase accessory protein FdhE [Syntrophomonas sp.]